METGRKVRTVIIGAGDITRKRHLPALLQAESAQFFGICNRTPEKALKIAEEYGLHFYKTAEEVFADSSIEAVLIATPPETHRELAVAALAAGKHVLLEKPMALTTEDAEAIREAEEKSTASLMMLHVQRFYEPHKKAKELLEEGMIMTYALGHDVCLLKRNGEQVFFDFDSSHVQSRLELTDAHEQFCRCILEGRKMPVTAEDGLISVQILQALFRADEEHCFQEIPVF